LTTDGTDDTDKGKKMSGKKMGRGIGRKMIGRKIRITVRKVKAFWGVGAIVRGRWVLLRSSPFGLQLVYRKREDANVVATWIRQNGCF